MKQHNRNKIIGTKKGNEDFPLIAMLSQLPSAPAPRNFESVLYRRLGITYFPLHRKVAILSGLCVFAASIYLTGRWVFGMIAPKLTLANIAQSFSTVYTGIMQAVGVIRIGYHMREIFIAFTNPWIFVGLAVVSSVLLMILIGIAGGAKRKTVPLNGH